MKLKYLNEQKDSQTARYMFFFALATTLLKTKFLFFNVICIFISLQLYSTYPSQFEIQINFSLLKIVHCTRDIIFAVSSTNTVSFFPSCWWASQVNIAASPAAALCHWIITDIKILLPNPPPSSTPQFGNKKYHRGDTVASWRTTAVSIQPQRCYPMLLCAQYHSPNRNAMKTK